LFCFVVVAVVSVHVFGFASHPQAGLGKGMLDNAISNLRAVKPARRASTTERLSHAVAQKERAEEPKLMFQLKPVKRYVRFSFVYLFLCFFVEFGY
jgi:hypothetical protein